MSHRRKIVRSALGALALLLAGGALHGAAARPGGGQHYSAPSRSSGGGYRSSPSRPSYSSRPSTPIYGGSSQSSGGSGDGGGVVLLLLVVGFMVMIIILALVNKARRAGVTALAVDRDRGVSALRAHDPGFDPAAFSARAQQTMEQVTTAWMSGRMGPARRLVSDGVYVRFQTQLALLAAQGLRNAMADFRVVAAELLAAESDPAWDTVHVKVVGEARDADVPLAATPEQQQRAVRGASLQQYQEVWSFLRRRGKLSRNGAPALAGRCPGCGADLPLSDAVRCEYCQVIVNSGEHDWVLAEITQPEEWRPAAATGRVPGLDELRGRDPAVSRQELEDRASVVFWKWAAARATGNRARLERFCRLPGQPAIVAAPLQRIAIGSADLKQVATAADGFDRADVEIAWSASLGGAAATGALLTMTLARAAGATSKRGLCSLDCPHCGGALAESDDVKCGYCGETLAGGKHEWALDGIREGG